MLIKEYLDKYYPIEPSHDWNKHRARLIAAALDKKIPDVWVTSIEHHTETLFVILVKNEQIAIFPHAEKWEVVTKDEWNIMSEDDAKRIWFIYKHGSEAEMVKDKYKDETINWSGDMFYPPPHAKVEEFNQKHYGGKLTRRQLSLLHHELKRISCETRGQKA